MDSKSDRDYGSHMKWPWNPKENIFNEDEFIDLFNFSLKLARSLTKNDQDLFKTTFQCLFWEGCHYAFGLKLYRRKQEIKKI